MRQTLVGLREEQVVQLDQAARLLGCSRSDLIREAIDIWFESYSDKRREVKENEHEV